MSYGTETVQIHKKLKLDKRRGSENWYARLTLDNGKREVKSTGTADLERAKEVALALYYETQARIANKLPASTRKFKAVAEHTVTRMKEDLAAGAGKQAYKDYIQAIDNWLVPYFGGTDIAKIDLARMTAFDAWRAEKMGKTPAASTISNHNAAMNRVLDEAELRGWITKSFRPTLLNKGRASESRGGFSRDEYVKIYSRLRTWHTETDNLKARDMRETLRNYALFLANSGLRHGTEALGLQWRNLEWHEDATGRYLVIYVSGKTGSRATVPRLRVQAVLERQLKLNAKLNFPSLEAAIAARSEEKVWVTRMGREADIHNLARHFEALLQVLKLKHGADNKVRTLYSFRHYYQTADLLRGMSVHKLGKQVGTSTPMMDKYYSKVSPLANAYEHSGKAWLDQKQAQKKSVVQAASVTLPQPSSVELAFRLHGAGVIDAGALLAALGANSNGYVATEEIKTLALTAVQNGKLDQKVLMQVLAGVAAGD